MVAYSRILWPDVVEHDDCVFLTAFKADNYDGFMAQTNCDKVSVEAVVNHVGRLLTDTWQTKLDRDFRDRSSTFRKIMVKTFCDTK